MATPRASADHYREQQRLTAAVLLNVRRLWGELDGDWDEAWRTIRARLVVLLTGAQMAVAFRTEQYIPNVLVETGQPDQPVAQIRPRAFAGTAGDGRPLATLLDGAPIRAKMAARTPVISGSLAEAARFAPSRADALAAGGRWLDMAAQTVLSDTSRSVTSTQIAVRPDLTGYVRMLNPPSCSRCAVLAGRVYKWNQGFRRHPRCDCRHIPVSEDVDGGDLTTDPQRYFDSLSRPEQDRIFTGAGAQAIRDGGDIGQVVNARRKMFTTADGVQVTRSNARRRGGTRLMPEAIYRVARSRDEAIELLRINGFVL